MCTTRHLAPPLVEYSGADLSEVSRAKQVTIDWANAARLPQRARPGGVPKACDRHRSNDVLSPLAVRDDTLDVGQQRAPGVGHVHRIDTAVRGGGARG